MLLYELVTGRHPFGSGPLPTTIAKVLSETPDPAGVPGHLWSIIDRATQKNPDDRFAAMNALLAALINIPGDQPAPRPDLRVAPARGATPGATKRSASDVPSKGQIGYLVQLG